MELSYPITSDLITHYVFQLRDFKANVTKACKLNLSQCRTLLDLAWYAGPQKTSAVAERLAIKPSALTAAVAELERRNLVERKEDVLDRRVITLELTSDGREVVACIDKVLADCITDWWESLPVCMQNFQFEGSMRLLQAVGEPPRAGDDDVNEDRAYLASILYCSHMMDVILKDSGLKTGEFRILFELIGHPEGMTPSQLGTALLMKLNDTTRILDCLVKRGLVLRSRDTADRRAMRIELTSDGYALMREVAPKVDAQFANGVYAVNEEDRAHFLECTSAVVDTMRRGFRK